MVGLTWPIPPEISDAVLERWLFTPAGIPDGSYTARLLLGGPEGIGRKVEEEAEEVARAARDESEQRAEGG